MLSRDGVQPQLAWRWPASLLSDTQKLDVVPGVLLLDESLAESEAALFLQWRHWLALFNTLQVLPGLVLATASGLRAGDCEAGKPAVLAAPAVADDGAALAAEWASVLQQALPAVHAGLRQLAAAKVQPPLAGYESADGRGRVAAEAELAWPDQRVAVLLPEQHDLGTVWQQAGWRVVLVSAAAGDTGWAERVLTMVMEAVAS